MNKFYIAFCLSFLIITSNAQTLGGEISRKPSNSRSGITSRNSISSKYVIKRIIDGVTLGKTTKQEVVAMLKKKGMNYSFQDINGIPVIEIDEYNTFGGNSWQHIFYYLYNNIVFQIDFSKEIKEGGDKASIDLEYSNIEMSLKRKYGEYQEKGISQQDYYTTVFNDKYTEVIMSKGKFQGYYHFSLTYSDLELYKRVFNKRENDL